MIDNVRQLLWRFGQSQIDAMFARQDEGPATDDSEFLPLVEVVITAFRTMETGDTVVEDLWNHAHAVYDRMCKEAVPESTADQNRELMQSYLLKTH